MLHELEADPSNDEDVGALNRWPERGVVPIERYPHLWERNCEEVGAGGGHRTRLVELRDLSRAKL